MKKLFICLTAIILLCSMNTVSFAAGKQVVNAPPKNLNIVVVDDLSKFTKVTSENFKEWNESPVDVQVVEENGNKLISIEKSADNFSIVQFANNSIGIKDYVAANGGKRPYGIGMYVKTEDSDVEIWTMRLHDAEDSWAKDLYLFDMKGELVTSNADKETQSDNGVVIPYDFEGYLIVTFRDTMSYSECTYLAWWIWTEPNGILYIDNIGLVSSKPSIITASSNPTKTPSATVSPTPSVPGSATPAEGVTSTPFSSNTETATSIITTQPTTKATVTSSSEATKTLPKSNWIIWVVIGVVVLAGGAAAALIIINKKKQSQ